VINLASLLGGAQSRRHNKYAAQPLFERNGLLRAKSGANSTAKAGVFIPLCHPFFIQHNGVRWAPLHAGAAAGTGFGMAIAVSLTGNCVGARNDLFGLPILRAVAEHFLEPCQEGEVFREKVCRRSLSTWTLAD
jgi:hypothetical protein